MCVFVCVSPECARLLNSETEGGRSERRNSLRTDVMLAQDIRADSSKAEVRKNRNCRSHIFPHTKWCTPTMDALTQLQLHLSGRTIEWMGVCERDREETKFIALNFCTSNWRLKTTVIFPLQCSVAYLFPHPWPQCNVILRIDFCVCLLPSFICHLLISTFTAWRASKFISTAGRVRKPLLILSNQKNLLFF